MLARARKDLRALGDPRKARVHRGFFKETADIFLGVTTPEIRLLSRQYQGLGLGQLRALVKSPVREECSLGHAILVRQFRCGDARARKRIFDFYLRNRKYIHSWDGVDDSAPYIVGPYLLGRDKKILYELARSPRLWDRRIAIVSTWWFIRHGQLAVTLRIARMLLADEEDLIHKACGWMLREVGKRDSPRLKRFLRMHLDTMPRTTLRYAIERFPPEERGAWLARKRAARHAPPRS